jgi:hypothetical protein
MSERIKACFESPEPSDDLRRRVRTLPQKQKGIPPPMQLKIFTGVATAVVLCGFWAVRHHAVPVHTPTLAQGSVKNHALIKVKVGFRTFCVYDYYLNTQGELCLLYTAGKLPADAWITDKNGKETYSDSSITTQDWLVSASTQGKMYSSLRHLPMTQSADLRPGEVSLERVAPDGSKYEAAVLRFSSLRLKPGALCYLSFTAPEHNNHGEELASVMRNKDYARGWWKTESIPLRLPEDEDRRERVPAAWRGCGVNVAAAIQQLERE